MVAVGQGCPKSTGLEDSRTRVRETQGLCRNTAAEAVGTDPVGAVAEGRSVHLLGGIGCGGEDLFRE